MKILKTKNALDWDFRRRLLMGVYDCMVAFPGRDMTALWQSVAFGNFEPVGLKSKKSGRRFDYVHDVSADAMLRWLAGGAKGNKIEWVSND